MVVRNQDDHIKNISFLMDEQGRWRLSPAYDMGYAYNPQGSWTAMHQMSVNGKFDGITRQDLMACAMRNNIKNASEIIDQVCSEVARWLEKALNCGVPQTMVDMIYRNMQTL
ncbi:MAG: HipA domain-containing protein [Paludibacteraceae bacterium]